MKKEKHNVAKFSLKEHFQTIDLKNTYQTSLSDLPGVEQFELLRSLVKIVAERYAISPLLDLDNLLSLGNVQASLHCALLIAGFSRFGPELEIDGVAGAQLDAPQVWRKTEINDIEVETTSLPFDAFGIDTLKRFGIEAARSIPRATFRNYSVARRGHSHP